MTDNPIKEKVAVSQSVTSDLKAGNWRFLVLLSSFFLMIVLKFRMTTFGVMYSRLLMDSQVSSTTVAWIYNIGQFSFDSSVVFAGPLCEIFGWRKVCFTSGILFGSATIISGFLENPLYLFITFSILTGISNGAFFAICNFCVPVYFTEKRGTAVGIIFAGFSLGDFVAPPVIYYLQQSYGERSALFVLGAIFFNTCAAAMVFHPVEWHIKSKKTTPQIVTLNEEIELVEGKVKENSTIESGSDIDFAVKRNSLPAIATSDPKLKPTPNSNFSNAVKAFTDLFGSLRENIRLLKNVRALIIALSSALFIISAINFIMLLPFALEDRGIPMENVVWFLSTMGIANIAATVMVSALTDMLKCSARWYFMAGTMLSAIAVAGFGYAKTNTLLYACMVMFGIGKGVSEPLIPLVMIELMGLELLPRIFGVSGLFNAFGFLTLGPLLGTIRDYIGDYDLTIQLLSASLFFSTLIWSFMPLAVVYDKRERIRKTKVQE